jgi:hypothetical protein
MAKIVDKTINRCISSETAYRHDVTLEFETGPDEVEEVEFHLTEFIDDEANESSWDWWAEPEGYDLELLGMGSDGALDYLSDLVIAEE